MKKNKNTFKPHVYIDRFTGKLYAATQIGRGNHGPHKQPEKYTSIGHWFGFEKFTTDIEDRAWIVRQKNKEKPISTLQLSQEEIAKIVSDRLINGHKAK